MHCYRVHNFSLVFVVESVKTAQVAMFLLSDQYQCGFPNNVLIKYFLC